MSEHTSKRWREDEADDYYILTEDGFKIAEVTFPQDRAVIIRIWNVYDALVTALEEILDEEMLSYLEYTDEDDDQKYQIGVKAGSIRRAAAALAQAKRKSPR